MRTANIGGRLAIWSASGYVDVATASGGRFEPDPQEVFERWDEFRLWWEGQPDTAGADFDAWSLLPPVPRPRQIFAIGLNYRAHAAESQLAVPENPHVFTKFASCLAGQDARVVLPSSRVDWEVELVVVIGRLAEAVPQERAWDYVAGLTIGQDLSERDVQLRGPAPQFSMGKSFAGFGPIGPELVTPDELGDPDDLEISCTVNGEAIQKGRTSDLVFSVPDLVSRLSAICALFPGDLIFTGTPAGVGMGRSPQRFLSSGDILVSHIEGLGELRTVLA